ncbi:MAG: DUF262 domain-containing protein [Chloroflexi bacterium]|nr:DUF262 domain-containing protein [Chloroflexota bacterium]
MRAEPQTVNQLFLAGGAIQYVLPYFQREYAWEKSHWETLYDDVMEIYNTKVDSESDQEHFMGALVVIQDGSSKGTMSRYTLVDGQQRLTTISLLLCALKEILEPNSTLGIEIQKLLINSDQHGEMFFKVVPTKKYDDRRAYFAVIEGDSTVRYESGIRRAWDYFLTRLTKAENEINVEKFFKCIVHGMQVVFIKLDRNEQHYKIFESLNAKGKALSQADLVRNYIAMKLPLERQERAFIEYWEEIDNLLKEKQKVARGMGELTSFLRHYLARINGTLSNEKQVYARFRDYMENNFASDEKFIQELGKLRRFAKFYDKLLRPENEPDKEIRGGIQRLNIVVESVSYPFLLYLYELQTDGTITNSEFVNALRILENYGVRRFLASEPVSYHNKMFPTLPRDLDVDDFVPSLTTLLLNKNYATNNGIRQNLKRQLRLGSTSKKRLILVLQSIDRHLARGTDGYPKLESEPTIEHVMPQTLSDAWKKHIGENWEEIHGEYLNVVGNLTLVTQLWNNDLSNGSFSEKKSKLAIHALRINSDYFPRDIPCWNDHAILARTEWLTKCVLEVWHSLGGFAPPSDVMGSVPSSLVIEGTQFSVDNWREVLIHTVDALISRFDNNDEVAKRYKGRISRHTHGFQHYHEVSNGWYVNLVWSDNAIFGNYTRKYR